jgi:hypothetical protein
MAFPIDGSEARIFKKQQPICNLRNFRRIAVVGSEDPDDFPAGVQAFFIEKGFERRPRKEVRMNDLI